MFNRRRFARGAGAVTAAAGVTALGFASADPRPVSPVIGTWRAFVHFPSGPAEDEFAVLTFFPGGFFQSFADGIHVATGRWEPTGPATVRFSLWQVMPVDLDGLPHRYHGEVQAIHDGRVRGDRLTTSGTWRGLDAEGSETARGPVTSTATRFGVRPF